MNLHEGKRKASRYQTHWKATGQAVKMRELWECKIDGQKLRVITDVGKLLRGIKRMMSTQNSSRVHGVERYIIIEITMFRQQMYQINK